MGVSFLTRLARTSHDNGHVKQLGKGSMRDYAPVEARSLDVVDVVHQTYLMVHNEKRLLLG